MVIKRDSRLEIKRIPLQDLRIFEHQKRYFDKLETYMEILDTYPDEDPGFILVKPRDFGYEVLDGHHRYCAHVMSGRSDALCIVIEETHEPRTDDQRDLEALRAKLSASPRADVGQAGLRDLQQEGIEALNRAWLKLHDQKKSLVVGISRDFTYALDKLITQEQQEKI